ncbi:MAG: peptidoglycan DD-metalloendopeptidase family protein [Solirubrobacterales bacterium]
MTQSKPLLDLRGKKVKAVGRAVAGILPEWRVFVRRADGTSTTFSVTRRRQVALLGSAAVISVWAGLATWMLSERPSHLAAKERELDQLISANRTTQQRLATAEKMVGEIAREVDAVHANVAALAETNATLAKDQPSGSGHTVAHAKGRVVVAMEDSEVPESGAVREQVRRLEASLERLRGATSRAVQQTADATDSRITATGRQLSRLGLDADKLVGAERRRGGQGGPFIPLNAAFSGESDGGIGVMMERMEYWSGMKAALQRLPLAEPVHGEYEINSGFGARSDPLNHRTGIHEGVDFGTAIGTPVYATGSGVVEFAGGKDRYGLTIDVNHGNGVTTRYAHLSRIKVTQGQRVTRATVIGLVGNTGRSTGPHLHYEVRVADAPRDPLKFISAGQDAPKAR